MRLSGVQQNCVAKLRNGMGEYYTCLSLRSLVTWNGDSTRSTEIMLNIMILQIFGKCLLQSQKRCWRDTEQTRSPCRLPVSLSLDKGYVDSTRPLALTVLGGFRELP